MAIHARTIQISLDHLVAEVATFPFVSQAALESPLHSLSYHLHSRTKTLWRSAESYFTQHFPSLSLDELVAVRNDMWFGRAIDEQTLEQDDWHVPLHKLLGSLSGFYLLDRGSVAEPRELDNDSILGAKESTARRTMRWLLFSMPADLLLAGLSVKATGPSRINLVCSPVDAVLRNYGYPETHLHLGAGLDFSSLWAAATNAAAHLNGDNQIKSDAFASPGAEHGEGHNLSHWHLRGCMVRYLLGAFLKFRGTTQTLADFFSQNLINNFLPVDPSERRRVREAIGDLRRGRIDAIFNSSSGIRPEGAYVELQSAYNAMCQPLVIASPRRLDEVQLLDPLSRWFLPLGHQGPSVQLQFLRLGLDYLYLQPDDVDFAKLFWQVERIRCQVYRHCVQRPLTPGLMNFIRFYERKSKLTRLLEDVELESCGVLGGVGHGLMSLEVRTKPKCDRDKQASEIRKFERVLAELRSTKANGDATKSPSHRLGKMQTSGWPEIECGLVLHFLKSRGKHSDKGEPRALDLGNNADPSDDNRAVGEPTNNQFRWGAFVRENEQEADAIAGAVEDNPRILSFLRGIDVCRDEHGVPCWVVARLFRRVKERVTSATSTYRHRIGKELPSLHTTAHVGEDFVHLATGLRYMDEAVVHLQLRSGDRIGHGLALGMRPDLWAQETTRMVMPREDRWLDLIWERGWHSHAGARFSADRIRYVEEEIVRLSTELFTPGTSDDEPYAWTPEAAIDLVRGLFNVELLSEMGFPDRELPRDRPEGLRRQLERYLTDPAVYRRCRHVEWVPVDRDMEAVTELQRLVRQRYASGGITIEVNPISNLLIGNLTDLQTHPLWRLTPGTDNDAEETLRICVGSDDPLPFSTTLPEEYQFLYDSFVLAGKSPAEARSWLCEIAKMSMESRFTLSPDLPELAGMPLGI